MNYELIVVFKPDVVGADSEKKLKALLEAEAFVVSEIVTSGKKRLSYPMKKLDDGIFITLQITGTKNPALVLTKLKLDDTVLRVLVLKEEKKKDKKLT